MSVLISLLGVLNTLSPLAVIALLSLVLFYQAKNSTNTETELYSISNNHLSGLPDMLASLQRIEDSLRTMNDNIIYIRARLNGRS